MKIFSVTNQKGGTGKSTITMLLACALASNLNKKIAILDCDLQSTIFELSELESNNLVEVFKCKVSDIEPHLIDLEKSKFDFVFIDFPRFTELDKKTLLYLSICDTIVVPVLGGIIEVLSVQKFVKALNQIESTHFILLNKHKRISEDFETLELLSKESKVFSSSVNDLKVFRDVSLSRSILDTKEGKKRFYSFYNEFKSLVIV